MYVMCVCREWKDGLVTTLLRKLCLRDIEADPSKKTDSKKSVVKLLQLDGEVRRPLYTSPGKEYCH